MYIYQCENAELHLLTCTEETPTGSQITDTHRAYQKPSPKKRGENANDPLEDSIKKNRLNNAIIYNSQIDFVVTLMVILDLLNKIIKQWKKWFAVLESSFSAEGV